MALKIGNKVYLSWDDIKDLVDILCDKISNDSNTITSVTGIQRGGLIPAVMISHKLNVPYVSKINSGTLVVDDIADTGETLKNIVTPYSATLHYKPTSIFKPTYYAQEVGSDWIIYPWEKSDSETIQDYLRK